jgi:hypothetical protein
MYPATNRLAGDSYSRCGVSACWVLPSSSTHTRSPSVIASAWSRVTYTVVTPSRSRIWPSTVRIDARRPASRFDSGSSIRNARGSRTIARAIATRCRCPPDSVAGCRDRYGSSPSIRAALATRRPISALGVPRSRSPNARFWRTVMRG